MSDLPTGTVTFLSADTLIGGTRRWGLLAVSMPPTLAPRGRPAREE